ncbi:cation:proton antiporter [candidate division WOR-3 bacterium]|nr:cation:proton antiporter [candidate division WOR-3 bacterium]
MNLVFQDLLALKTLLSNHPMFAAGILLIAGYLLGRLAAKISLPEITGYIIAGLLVSDAVTGLYPRSMGHSFRFATEIALGLIALTIGGEFSLVKLRRLGRNVVVITVVQILSTFIIVTVALLLFKMQLPYALLLGAIATATAPAATVAIVQALRAHGLFVDYLYGVVALDDAGCVILFGTIFAFASTLLAPSGGMGSLAMVFEAIGEVLFSVLIGLLSSLIIHYGTRRKKKTNEIMIISIGVIFLSTALSIVLHLSPLLTNMAAGCLLINMSARNHRIFRILEPLTPPLYALFFVIAGTELQPHILLKSGTFLFGAIYILARAVGKYGGVYLGSSLIKAPSSIRNYLGLSMLPQAGVAIGLVLLIQASPLMSHVGEHQQQFILSMINIVLLSVFVNELIGPPLSKLAVIKGNEMEE